MYSRVVAAGRVVVQPHQRGEAGIGLAGVGGADRIDDDAAECVVEGNPAGGIDAADTDDDRESGQCRFRYTRSIAIAVASPPPMHSAATPLLPPVALRAWASVTSRRLPVEPMGCPWAQAPP